MEFMNIIASVSILICIVLIILVPILHLMFYAKFSDTDNKYLSDNYHISDNLYSKEIFNNLELSLPLIIYIVIIAIFLLLYGLLKAEKIRIPYYFNNLNNSFTIYIFLLLTFFLILYLSTFYPTLYEIYQFKKKIKNDIILNTNEDYLDDLAGKKLSEYTNEVFTNAVEKKINESKVFSIKKYTDIVEILYTHYLLNIIKEYEHTNDSKEKIIISKAMFHTYNIIKYIKINKLYNNNFLRLSDETIKTILQSTSVNTPSNKKTFVEKIYYSYLKNITILISDINALSKKYNKIYSPIIISFTIFVIITIMAYINRNNLNKESIINFFDNAVKVISDLILSKSTKI